MNIKAINVISNFMGNKSLNTIQKTQKANFGTKDTVSFSGKKSSKKPEFYGPIYKNLEELDTERERKIPEIREAFKRGEDIREDREKLILSRIPTALYDAEEFTKKHSEFNMEDVGQELILCVIKATDVEIQSDSKCRTFSAGYSAKKESYFKKLLNEPQTEELDMEMPDKMPFDKIIDRLMLKKDVDKLLDSLVSNEKRTLVMRFGLQGEERHTFEEIAKEAGTSISRQENLLETALRKIRYPARARKLYPYCQTKSDEQIDYSKMPIEALFQHIKNAYRYFPESEFRKEYVEELRRAIEKNINSGNS